MREQEGVQEDPVRGPWREAEFAGETGGAGGRCGFVKACWNPVQSAAIPRWTPFR